MRIIKNYCERKSSITTKQILDFVAEFMSVSVWDIRSRSKKREIVAARHIAAYLIRKRTQSSLKVTGELLGGRDHSTVIHSIRVVEDELFTKGEYCNIYRHLIDNIPNMVKLKVA